MLSLNAESCELFNIPFYQFAQMKKFCPEDIPAIKANYKLHWDNWKAIIQEVAKQLGMPFTKPHIESWTNGWQVRAHFFAYFKYEFHKLICNNIINGLINLISNNLQILIFGEKMKANMMIFAK